MMENSPVDMEKLMKALELSMIADIPCTLTPKEAMKLRGEVLALRRIVGKLVEGGEWISVKDRLPHDDINLHKWVLAVNMDDVEPVPFVVGFTLDYGNPNFEYLHVTHWMPIPLLPESEDE
jgi:hypothetical protein